MAVPAGIKLDDGTGYNVSKCFPARSLLGGSDDGAWLVSYRSEQKRRLKAVLARKEGKTATQIEHEQRRQRRVKEQTGDDGVTRGLLDGFFLLKHCCVEDPSELCNVNVAGQQLSDGREEDFELFENVAYVNAAENLLPFECFRGFRNLRELEIPLNGLRGLNISFEDFPSLETVDLSYNNLSKDDILALGVLSKLKVLRLSGNQLRSLPVEMFKPHRVATSGSENSHLPRFAVLEELSLDDNHLSDLATFASLAGLRRLKRLNLEKNLIQAVPHLKAVSGRHVAVDGRGTTSQKPEGVGTLDATANTASGGDPVSSSTCHSEEQPESDSASAPDVSHGRGNPPPPFPELEYLNLTNNKIAFEENLLAVAAWPMLVELDIYDNPLTVHNSGDPPLLKQYLIDRLGVCMRRKKPEGARKSATVHVAPHRKVKEVAKPLPKRPHPALLLAERPAILAADSASGPRCDPLPPISSASPPPQEGDQTGGDRLVSATLTSSHADQGPQDDDDDDLDDPVFLTQVDDREDESRNLTPEMKGERPLSNPKNVGPPCNPKDTPVKGYEILYDGPEDSEVYVHNDIQSNLRSLKLALQHKPVYRNDVDLDKLQKPFNPHQKNVAEPRPPHKTKEEELQEVFEAMKNRVTVTEENLGRILEDKRRMREEFPEVPKLLKEIQAKYKSVRAEAMQEKHQFAEAQEALVKTAKEIKSHIPQTSSR